MCEKCVATVTMFKEKRKEPEEQTMTNRVVFRYELDVIDEPQGLFLGADSKFISCLEDRSHPGNIEIWVEIEHGGKLTQAPASIFRVFGTGQAIPPGLEHVGTVFTKSGFVWHIYKTVSALAE